MKKINIWTTVARMAMVYLLFLTVVGCQKSGNFLIDEATQKMDSKFISYDSLLNAAPNGWKMLVYPDIAKNPSNKGGYSFFVKFDSNNKRVEMLADFDKETRTVPKVSQYALKFTSLTTLSFSTYTYIHRVADPSSTISGGQQVGWGNRVDTEYSFLRTSVNMDTIYLKGNLQNCNALLIRATAEESSFFHKEKKYDELLNQFSEAVKGKIGLHLDISGQLTYMNLALVQRQVVFAKEINADSVLIHRSGIAFDGTHTLRLDRPLQVDGQTIDRIELRDGQFAALSETGATIKVVEKEFPSISAFKMISSGAYSSIYVPFDNTFYISGSQYEGHDWPNKASSQSFLTKSLTADGNLTFGLILSQIRLYNATVSFKADQRRFMFTLNMGIYDGDKPAAPGASRGTPDEFYDKFGFPYQFRYVYNNEEVLTTYYEGPKFVYAAQFPQLKNLFMTELSEGQYSLKYTKSPRELLIAFYNTSDGKILFEGRPF